MVVFNLNSAYVTIEYGHGVDVSGDWKSEGMVMLKKGHNAFKKI